MVSGPAHEALAHPFPLMDNGLLAILLGQLFEQVQPKGLEYLLPPPPTPPRNYPTPFIDWGHPQPYGVSSGCNVLSYLKHPFPSTGFTCS